MLILGTTHVNFYFCVVIIKKYFLVLLGTILLSSCAGTKPIAPHTQVVSTVSLVPNDDLADIENDLAIGVNLPNNDTTYETNTELLEVNKQVEQLLINQLAKNKNVKYAQGYRIQIYIGRDRKTADDSKIYIYQNHPNLNPYLTFNLPNYKLLVGDFLTKTEAVLALNQLKGAFPEAVLVSEKIDIKKSFGKE